MSAQVRRAGEPRAIVALALVLGCSPPAAATTDADVLADVARPTDAADAPAPFPPPARDVVPAVGSTSTLDIATWNVRFFPTTAETPSRVADVVTSMDLDVLVLEEVNDAAAFAELDARLMEHEGWLAPARTGQSLYIGIFHRSATTRLESVREELLDDPAFAPGARPVLHARITYLPSATAPTLDVFGVHLAAIDALGRAAQMRVLEAWLRAETDAGRLGTYCVVGDWNEEPTGREGRANWAIYTAAPDRYVLETQWLVDNLIPTHVGGAIIDHILTSASMHAWVGAAHPTVTHPDARWPDYDAIVSDHYPVSLSLAPP